MDLIFFGMQGSGKGTLGKAVAERYDLQIFETGGELRKLSGQTTELAQKVKSIIESGNLVPNEVVMEIVENFMNQLSPGTNILFDGIPRTVEQAKSLNALLQKHNRTFTGVYLDLSEEIAFHRLTTRRICEKCKTVYPADYTKDNCEKCGGNLITRSDDNPEAIRTRLQAFSQETIPAINLYENSLIKLDGRPPIDEVRVAAFAELDKILTTSTSTAKC